MFNHDLTFWIAVIGATIVKLATSPYYSFLRAMLTVFAAVFAAVVFTDPVVHWLGLAPRAYSTPIAALLALTGEGLMRTIIAIANDPSRVLEYLKAWRGRK